MTRKFWVPGEIALHPVALLGMAMTWCNDHYWKQHSAGWITGKLSDVAGLAFFPLWVAALLELALLLAGRRWLVRTPVMLAIVIATAVLFSSIKLSHAASNAYTGFVGRICTATKYDSAARVSARNSVDPTDLLALPALGIGYWIIRKRDAVRGKSVG
jgi:hypothetical protein